MAPDILEQSLSLYRAMSGELSDLDAFRAAMIAEERIIYEFQPIAATYSFNRVTCGIAMPGLGPTSLSRRAACA